VLIDLATATGKPVGGAIDLSIARSGELHGLAGWFSAELAPGIEITNAPGDSSTPYQQAWLPLAEPTPVRAGDAVGVRIETRDGATWRWDVQVRGPDGETRATFAQATRRCFPLLRE
jgi:hypothetical protein